VLIGDDTAAGSGDAGNFAQTVDQRTNENQTVRATNATGGTFTLTFNGQTTAPIPFNATGAQIEAALDAFLDGRQLDYIFPTHPELPHCGLMPSWSKGTSLLASSMRRFKSSGLSNAPVFELTKPRISRLSFGI